MLGPMSVDRRRPVAAVLALLGALLVVAAVIGTAVHYAAQPDAAVGTPPGSSAWDRMQAGAQREGSDLLDRAAGRESEARVVEDLAETQDLLNGRPRQTLGWATPHEKLTELITGVAIAA